MNETRVRIVHGFAVAPVVFRPLLRRLGHDSLDATLYRYPSVGLELDDIVEGLASDLNDRQPDAIIAHSLGCIATWLAVRETKWRGPIALLAPPLTTLPTTRFIPRRMSWPFAPLLDHRAMTLEPGFRLPELENCAIKIIAGRLDFSVPVSLTRHSGVDEHSVTLHTHNSMLFSSSVATACSKWIARHRSASETIEPRGR